MGRLGVEMWMRTYEVQQMQDQLEPTSVLADLQANGSRAGLTSDWNMDSFHLTIKYSDKLLSAAKFWLQRHRLWSVRRDNIWVDLAGQVNYEQHGLYNTDNQIQTTEIETGFIAGSFVVFVRNF